MMPDPVTTSKAVADGIASGGVLYVLCLVVIVVIAVSYFQNGRISDALIENARSQMVVADACREMKSTLNNSNARDEDTRIKVHEHDKRAEAIQAEVHEINQKVDKLHCVRAKLDATT